MARPTTGGAVARLAICGRACCLSSTCAHTSGETKPTGLTPKFERERRLEPGEEERLRALKKDDWRWRLRFVAALETGCRIGEILNVQFKQLRWDLNELHLSNRTTKGLRTRYLPLSQELRAMLDHANISTSRRYLKPSKLALHTTIQRIDAHRRERGDAANGSRTWSSCGKTCSRGHKKGHMLIESFVSVKAETA